MAMLVRRSSSGKNAHFANVLTEFDDFSQAAAAENGAATQAEPSRPLEAKTPAPPANPAPEKSRPNPFTTALPKAGAAAAEAPPSSDVPPPSPVSPLSPSNSPAKRLLKKGATKVQAKAPPVMSVLQSFHKIAGIVEAALKAKEPDDPPATVVGQKSDAAADDSPDRRGVLVGRPAVSGGAAAAAAAAPRPAGEGGAGAVAGAPAAVGSAMSSPLPGSCGAAPGLRSSSACSTGSRLADIFDDRGYLGRETPQHWALLSCPVRPTHESRVPPGAGPTKLPKRRQMSNALATLQLDDERTKQRNRKAHCARRKTKDQQKARRVVLLFEPVSLEEPYVSKYAELSDDDNHAGDSEYETKGALGLGKFRRATAMLLTNTALVRKQEKDHVRDSDALNSGISSAQRLRLQALFRFFTLRVAGPHKAELMQRCTWFHFLRFCDLVGNPGGVPHSVAADIFDLLKDEALDPPAMNFGAWFGAVMRTVRTCTGNDKVQGMRLFFDVCLPCCENKLASVMVAGGQAALPASPANGIVGHRVRASTADAVTPRGRPRRASNAEAEASSTSASAASDTRADWRPLPPAGWQSDLAEEQMCEPEVLQLLHEHAPALRRLFLDVARWAPGTPHGQLAAAKAARLNPVQPKKEQQRVKRSNLLATPPAVPAASGARAEESSGSEENYALPESDEEFEPDSLTSPSTFGRQSSPFVPPSERLRAKKAERSKPAKRVRMSRDNFEAMLRELAIFPEMVQLHSLEHHVSLSLSRRRKTEFTYGAFVECLCRILFVYLCAYGNVLQQKTTSHHRCVWMIALLRKRCEMYGEKIGLDDGLIGEGGLDDDDDDNFGSPSLWDKRRYCDIDKLGAKEILLWKTMVCKISAYDLPATWSERRS
eukprot:TRINITY_DN26459_c1_g1_i2.p1 TRINITY_DN26459_c1_g1~~TRINITY_DN26459_c1_g1_i2.p1  ORF type:complete len:882 (-),score=208.98 TRINITY_DN26459_c1_g1_i2:185-2830(-)